MSASTVSRTTGGALPSFFRACCREAANRSAHGEPVGYDHPGYHLTLAVETLSPHEIEEEEWEQHVEELRGHVEAMADDAVLDWFARWLPRCMAMIPKRRRDKFLKGIYRAAVRHDWLDESEI